MTQKFWKNDFVRIKQGSKQGIVGMVTSCMTTGNRCKYFVSNHYYRNESLGRFYSYELEHISKDEYLKNINRF